MSRPSRAAEARLTARLEQVLKGSGERGTRGSGADGDRDAVAGTCDCCPAAAAVLVRLCSGRVLMLCGHHGRRHAPALWEQCAEVVGELAFAART